ncbi:hypothetical protein BON30_39135 [Cystobacter ferrugineus]|uniref:CHRD domain-containing protein n=2 Tax=Cystobacter ferrugineus TaxID=83449 RepID=A0A1L9AYK3_9BACT|nr:hypothetical protein BON30_39135 [Cystobacter ferrugineus]
MHQAVRMLVGVALVGLVGCGGSGYIATTQMSGSDAVPAANTDARGTATAELKGGELIVQGTFTGLRSNLYEVSGSSVHVYKGAVGVAGGIVFGLQVTTTDQRNGSFRGTQKLSSEDEEAFRNGQLYVNVHTADNRGGELRGQLVPVEVD